MLPVRCPYCQESLEVPDSLAGCLVRCHDCDGVLRAPQLETDESSIAVASPQLQVQKGPNHPNPEVQEFVQAMEKKAQEEAERKPSDRRRVPVDLFAGLIFLGGGLALMANALLGGAGGGMFVTLIHGILLPIILMLLGAICLMSWSK